MRRQFLENKSVQKEKPKIDTDTLWNVILKNFFFLVFNKGRNNQTLSHYKTRKQASRIITLSEQQQFHVNLIKLIYVEMITFRTSHHCC